MSTGAAERSDAVKTPRVAHDAETAEGGAAQRGRWHVVVPLKPFRIGKSRLGVGLPRREAFARAMAKDTLRAIAASERVASLTVVTSDPHGIRRFAPETARVIREPTRSGLNGALRFALDEIGEGEWRAVIVGDLPALRSSDVDAVLASAESVQRGVVADREGEGTTMITAAPGTLLEPNFGPDSFARHVRTACAPFAVAEGSTLRRDVDSLADLLSADAEVGVGPATSAVLRELRAEAQGSVRDAEAASS